MKLNVFSMSWGDGGDTPIRTSPLLTPSLPFNPVPEHWGLPFAKGKADKKECASLLSLAPPFHSLLSNFY